MKRFLAMLMLVVMMCGCAGLAEGKTFDPSLLEGKEGYSYDKFKRTWYYYEGTAAIDGNDNVFMTQIGLMGEKKRINKFNCCLCCSKKSATKLYRRCN